MAKYMVLIYGDEQVWTTWSEQEARANQRGHDAFAAAAGPAILGTHPLEPTSTATSLRAGPDGRPTVTDGPFLQTAEALGGYYLLEAADLDEAIRLASQLPEVSAPHGGAEIRPIRDVG